MKQTFCILSNLGLFWDGLRQYFYYENQAKGAGEEYYTMRASELPVFINQTWEARVFTSKHLGKEATGEFAQFAHEISCLLFLRAQIVSLLEG